MEVVEDRFRVMGSEAHVVIAGGSPGLVEAAHRVLTDLEGAWSRFIPTSDVSRMNARPDDEIEVRPETIRLVERATAGWRLTNGNFDPTVLAAILAAGYEHSLDEPAAASVSARVGAAAAPGCESIIIDAARGTVRLGNPSGFDPGGIGKGLAADITVERMLDLGAEGVMVNIGGDLRATGLPPTRDGWIVAVEDPFDHRHEIARIRFSDGAVATTTARHGRWMIEGTPAQHIIDPANGFTVDSTAIAATVVAGEGWIAEVVAKGALVAGATAGIALIDDLGLSGLVLDRQGRMRLSARVEVFL